MHIYCLYCCKRVSQKINNANIICKNLNCKTKELYTSFKVWSLSLQPDGIHFLYFKFIHNAKYQRCTTSVSKFNEFKLRLKSPRNRFQLSAGLNLEKFKTILSGTKHIFRCFKFGLMLQNIKTNKFELVTSIHYSVPFS